MQRVAATRVAGAAAAAAAAAAAGKPAESAAARDETSSFELIRPAEIAKARRSVEAVSSDEEFETTTSPDGSSWIVPKPEPAPLSEEEQAVASAAFETAAELAQDPALQRLVLERLGPRVQRNLTMAAAAPAAAEAAPAAAPADDDTDDADEGWGHPFSPDGFYYVGRPGDESSSVASSFVVGSELFEAIIADVDATAADANGAAASASALSSAAPSVSVPADEKEGEEEARGVPAGAAVAAVVLGITVGLITCALLTRLNPAAGKAVAKAAHAALKKAFSRSCRAF